jgi:uncharacterized membrane protein
VAAANQGNPEMQLDSTTLRNIEGIAQIEKEALSKRTLSARVGDVIAVRAGQMWFIAAHAVWFGIWMCLNSKPLTGRVPFDPYPYALLTMIVSLESIFLSLFILMSQNRATLQADQRNHLDLQINLLSEHENTKMLQMLQAICEHHGLAISADPEIAELVERTEPKRVLEELRDNLPPTE